MLLKVYDQPWIKGLSERDLFVAHGKGTIFDASVADAKREAKECRNYWKAHGKYPPGMGPMIMTVPQTIVDGALQVFHEMYVKDNDTKDFWCWMWHQYEDFRCVPWTKCPWCGKLSRAFSVAASASPSIS